MPDYNVAPTDFPPPVEATPDVRKAYLAQAVARKVALGWRVESYTDTQVVLIKGKQTSHVLHLLMACFTFGLWFFVWPFVHHANRRRVRVLTVDPYGQVFAQ